MTMREQLYAADRGGGGQSSRGAAADLVEADGLIADLSALIDAGLVVVHEHVLGPARYGIAASPPARPSGRSRRRNRTAQRPSFPTSSVLRSAYARHP
jgi:hypothetical protein